MRGGVLSEAEAAARCRDGAAEFSRGFQRFLNNDFYVGEGFPVSFPSAAQPGSSGTSAINASSV